MFLNIKELDTG